MGSITIHGLDDELDRRIRSEAQARSQSLNKTIKHLLAKSLGMGGRRVDRRQDFSDLFGTWSQEDLVAFDRATETFGVIDPEEWK